MRRLQPLSTVAGLSAAVLLGVSLHVVRTFAQGAPAGQPADIHILPVSGNVSMLVGAGGNIAVSVGPDGVLLVDSGLAASSPKVLDAIRTLSDKPVRYIINTHIHPDHTGGNPNMGARPTGGGGDLNQRGAAVDVQIIGHETLFTRMSAMVNGKPAAPSEAWPTIQFPDRKDMNFNDEPIEILHQKAAHTDGDSLVLFRKSDVIVTGDIFVTTSYPRIDLERGGTVNGIVDGLNNIIEIAVPKNLEEGGTQIIPGHGRQCEESDVVEFRDMMTIIRDRVQDLVNKGKSLAEVKAAKPTFDYDRRYGATTGGWTTDMFVEAVFKTLSKKS